MRSIAEKYQLTLLQLACAWNLSQSPVQSVVPTLIQETATDKPIEAKLDELSSLSTVKLGPDEVEEISRIGDNRGCMALKGANRSHTTTPEADKWSLSADLEAVGKRWGIDPDHDLAYAHAGQA